MKTCICIITFNKPELLGTQIKHLKEYINADLKVFDNSSNFEASKVIKEISEGEGVEYIRTGFREGDSSRSHGLACNVAYDWCKDYEITVLLDHDIFPFKHYTFKTEGLQGIAQVRDKFVYLWPGMLAIRNEHFTDLSFMPCTYENINLDTGGELAHLKKHFEYVQEGYDETEGERYAVIDDAFMHFQNGSNWLNVDNYDERISKLMQELKKKCQQYS